MQAVLTELETVKDLNKELAWKLAKAESELESARIKLEIQEKANKAAFVSRIADAVVTSKFQSFNNNFETHLEDGKNEEWHFEKYKGLDDLLNEIEGNGPVPLSPNTIRKNCDRMMDHVRENGCQFDITNNMFDLAENQLLNTKLGSVWNDCTRSDFRGQEKELKKALKERTSECESLKKKLEKFERDKQQWENQKRVLESKQPMDVQILQSQKRELTMQLDREQAEKQELFLQINTLIAQLAEISRDKMEQSSASLEAENEVLKNEFRNVQEIQTRLNNDVQNLQEELRLKNTEVEITRDEVKRLQILLDSERMRFEETVDGLERDLQLKAAALQNAMLAKKDEKVLEIEINRLKTENIEMQKQIDGFHADGSKLFAAEAQMKKLKEEFDNSKRIWERREKELVVMEDEIDAKETEMLEKNKRIGDLEQKVVILAEEISELEKIIANHRLNSEKLSQDLRDLRRTLEEKENEINKLKSALVDSQSDRAENEIRRDQYTPVHQKDGEEEVDSLQESYNRSLFEAQEKLKIIEAKIKTKEEVELELRSLLREQKDKLVANEKQMLVDQTQIKDLKAQIANMNTYDIQEEIKQLQNELEISRKECSDLRTALENMDDPERCSHDTVRGLEEVLSEMEKKLRASEKEREASKENLKSVEKDCAEFKSMLMSTTRKLESTKEDAARLEQEVQRLLVENSKLMEKTSLEEEIITLASSLQSSRTECNSKQDEVIELRNQLCELREENDKLLVNTNSELENLQNSLDHAQDECEKWKELTKKCQDENESIKEKNTVLAKKISELTSDLQIKDGELAALRGHMEIKHQQTLLNLKNDFQSRIMDLTDENSRLRADLETKSEKINEMKKVDEDKSEKNAKKLEELEAAKVDLMNQNRILSDYVQAEKEKTKALSNDIVAKDTEIDILNSELEKSRVELKLANAQQNESDKFLTKEEISELMAENARLAGELLKTQSHSDRESAKERANMQKEFDERLKVIENEWKAKQSKLIDKNEMDKLEKEFVSRLESKEKEMRKKFDEERRDFENEQKILREKNEQLLHEKENLNSEFERLIASEKEANTKLKGKFAEVLDKFQRSEADIKSLKQKLEEAEKNLRTNVDNESPKPPPRQKLNGTGTPVLFEPTALNHLEEENKKLKIEIEKQHRLIVVLRRKLQATQQHC